MTKCVYFSLLSVITSPFTWHGQCVHRIQATVKEAHVAAGLCHPIWIPCRSAGYYKNAHTSALPIITLYYNVWEELLNKLEPLSMNTDIINRGPLLVTPSINQNREPLKNSSPQSGRPGPNMYCMVSHSFKWWSSKTTYPLQCPQQGKCTATSDFFVDYSWSPGVLKPRPTEIFWSMGQLEFKQGGLNDTTPLRSYNLTLY